MHMTTLPQPFQAAVQPRPRYSGGALSFTCSDALTHPGSKFGPPSKFRLQAVLTKEAQLEVKEAAQAKLEEHTPNLSDLQDKLNAARLRIRQLQVAQADVADLQDELQAARQQVVRMQRMQATRMESVQAELQTMRSQLEGVQDAQAQMKTMQAELKAARGQIMSLQLELQAARAQLSTLQAVQNEAKSARAMVTDLQGQLASSNEETEKAHAMVVQLQAQLQLLQSDYTDLLNRHHRALQYVAAAEAAKAAAAPNDIPSLYLRLPKAPEEVPDLYLKLAEQYEEAAELQALLSYPIRSADQLAAPAEPLAQLLDASATTTPGAPETPAETAPATFSITDAVADSSDNKPTQADSLPALPTNGTILVKANDSLASSSPAPQRELAMASASGSTSSKSLGAQVASVLTAAFTITAGCIVVQQYMDSNQKLLEGQSASMSAMLSSPTAVAATYSDIRPATAVLDAAPAVAFDFDQAMSPFGVAGEAAEVTQDQPMLLLADATMAITGLALTAAATSAVETAQLAVSAASGASVLDTAMTMFASQSEASLTTEPAVEAAQYDFAHMYIKDNVIVIPAL